MRKIKLNLEPSQKYDCYSKKGEGNNCWYVFKSPDKKNSINKSGYTKQEAQNVVLQRNQIIERHVIDTGLQEAKKLLAEWIQVTSQFEGGEKLSHMNSFVDLRADIKSYLIKSGCRKEDLS